MKNKNIAEEESDVHNDQKINNTQTSWSEKEAWFARYSKGKLFWWQNNSLNTIYFSLKMSAAKVVTQTANSIQ